MLSNYRFWCIGFFFTFTLFAFASCGGQDAEDSAPAAAEEPSATVENLADAQNLITKTSISCQRMPGGCPSNIAMLLSITPKVRGFEVGACTSFLISHNLLLTNSHCIPDDIRSIGASCKDRIKFVFPAGAGRRQETMACDSIINTTTLPGSSMMTAPDYAIVKLVRSTSRPALRLNHEGLPQDFPVSITRISPHFNAHSVRGDMSTTHCLTAYKTFFIPQLTQPQAPVMTLAGCKAVHGNSGSPVFDSSGSVRALLYMGLELDPAAKVRIASILPRGPLQQITGVTSLACINTPFDGSRALPAPCGLDLSRAATDASRRGFVTQDDQKTLAQEIQYRFQNWTATNGMADLMRWHLQFQSPGPGTLMFRPVPSCLVRFTSSNAINRNLEMNMPYWAGRFQLNQKLQLARTLATTNSERNYLELNAPGGGRGYVQIREIRGRSYSSNGMPRYRFGDTWYENSLDNCGGDPLALSDAMALDEGYETSGLPLEDGAALVSEDTIVTPF